MLSSQKTLFPRQWLNIQDKYDIYLGENKILDWDSPGERYKIKEFRTELIVSPSEQASGEDVIRRIKYEQLLEIGLKIVSINASGINKYRSRQKKIYKIVKRSADREDYGQIPMNHAIFFDFTNQRAKLIGRGAGQTNEGDWVYARFKRYRGNEYVGKMRDNLFALRYNKVMSMLGHDMSTLKRIRVDEMPILITDNNEYLCLENFSDEPTFAAVGRKRVGKSLLCHGIIDRGFWQFKKRTGIINDYLRECGTWCMPWETNKFNLEGNTFINKLKSIGQTTRPLPCVYLHANTDNLKNLTHGEDLGFRFSFPFNELIQNFDIYFKGYKNWELDKSLPYFRNIKQSLLECETEDDVVNMIQTILPDKLEQVKVKIDNVMRDIFSQKILDISTGINAKWTLKDKKTGNTKEYSPFVACLVANMVPVLVTSNFKPKMYYPHYFRYIVNDIMDKQINDEDFIHNNYSIWLFCDELTSIDNKKNPTVASHILSSVVAEGGPSRLGFGWATQNAEKISDRIYTNTNFLFVFRLQNQEQAATIQKNFGLEKEKQNEMLRLKKFEVMALTSERYIVYDRYGHRYKTDEPVKGLDLEGLRGWSVPSLSRHKPPKSTD